MTSYAIKTTVHFEDGTSAEFFPAVPGPVDVEPGPITPAPPQTPDSFDHIVTPEAPNLDFAVPGPIRSLDFELTFTAGPELAASKRVQILGAAGTSPQKPWVHFDLLILLLLVDGEKWILRHGIGMSHGKKLRDSAVMRFGPGDEVQISASVHFAERHCWVEIAKKGVTDGGRSGVSLAFDMEDGRDVYDRPILIRFGEPSIQGDEGPWPGARYSGSVEVDDD